MEVAGSRDLRGMGQHYEHHRPFVSPVAAQDLRLGEWVRPWEFDGVRGSVWIALICDMRSQALRPGRLCAGCRRELRSRHLQLPGQRCRLRRQG